MISLLIYSISSAYLGFESIRSVKKAGVSGIRRIIFFKLPSIRNVHHAGGVVFCAASQFFHIQMLWWGIGFQ
jgi:hypothetical protein